MARKRTFSSPQKPLESHGLQQNPGPEEPAAPAAADFSAELAAQPEIPAGEPLPALADIFDRPNKSLQSVQFFAATREYAKQPGAEGACWYVYRVWPAIDRRLVDPNSKTYIEKLAEGVLSEDYLLRKHGSGDYSIRFCDENKPRGHTQIARTVVRLRHDDFPPALDRAELVVGDPANKSYIEGLRARGQWSDGTDDMGHNQQFVDLAARVLEQGIKSSGGSSSSLEAGAISRVIEMMAEGGKQAAQLARGGADPMAMVEMLAKLGLIGQPKSDTGSIELLKFVVDTQQKNHEMMLKVLEAKTPASSVTSGVDELLKLQQALKGFGGVGRDRGGFDWGQFLQSLPAVFASAAPLLAPFLQQRAPAPGGAYPAPPAAVQFMPPNPPTVSSPPATPPPADPPAAELAIDPAMADQFAQQIAAMLARGVPGSDFATTICTAFGDDVYDQIRALGKPRILAELQRTASWPVLAPAQPAVELFIDDFLAYGDPGDNDDPGDAPAAAL